MCSKSITASVSLDEFRIESSAHYLGDDIVVSVSGGVQHHIGAVSIAVYEPVRDSATVSTVCVYSHRDDIISAYFAKKISREMKCTVSVSAGIHIDEASNEQINMLSELSFKCCDELIKLLKSGRQSL